MTLRGRLAVYFVLIVVVPLGAVAAAAAVLVPRELAERADDRLRTATTAAAAMSAERLQRAEAAVARIARGLAATAPAARPGRLEAARRDEGLDFVALDQAVAARPADYAPGIYPTPADAVRGPAVLRAVAVLERGATLQAGWFLDRRFAQQVGDATGMEAAVVSGSIVVAATSPRVASLRAGAPAGSTPFDLGETRAVLLAAAAHGEPAPRLLVATDPGGSAIFPLAVFLIAVAGIALATGLGVVLARAIVRPLTRLSEQAMAIAAGDWSARVEVLGRDEIARVGAAFNVMAAGVGSSMQELQGSRDELRRTLERLGSTLRSTRGMEEMVGAVLEAAAVTLGADAGALFRVAAGGMLTLEASLGLEAAQATREAALEAVRSAQPVLRPGFSGSDPLGRAVVAAPLRKGSNVVGVIALAAGGIEPFGDGDLAALASFATQASVALDNVFHREVAERLALTDPLTGVPNRRALERMLQSRVDQALRAGAAASVMMIDLDRFKAVNDRFGHLEGDRVLKEICRRIESVVRSDEAVLARFGGEEFVLLVSQDSAGAERVAERVRRVVESEPFGAGRGAITVTVSIGVASVPADGRRAADVLAAADAAMYRAKQRGRNRVEVCRRMEVGSA